jgi:peptide/nickel transport system substrate-binding protein
MGMPGDLATLDGHLTQGLTGFDTLWQVFDRLTAYDATLQPQPMLAESWDVAPDLRQFKLNLRKGVQFHSGREFTSDDVKWNLLRVRDPKVAAGGFVNQSNWFTSIETPDKSTVVLKSDQPRPAAFDFFEFLNMLDRESMEAPDANQKAVGTGPFAFAEWAQGSHVRLTRNTNYWRAGRPFLEGMTASIITDQQARLAQLESGSLDLIPNPPAVHLARLRGDSSYQVLVHPLSAQFFVLASNVLMPPLDNKLVRQALHLAIDRTRFTSTVLAGLDEPEALPWPTFSPAYEAAKQAPVYDLDRARSLLAQSGVGSFTMDALISSASDELFELVQILQSDLSTLGVTLTIQRLQSAALLDQINNRRYRGITIGSQNFAQLEPVTILTRSRTYDPAMNNEGFKSDRYTQLITAAGGEADAAKRKQVYAQINDLLLDECFASVVSQFRPKLVMRTAVHGVEPTLHEGFSYADTWID